MRKRTSFQSVLRGFHFWEKIALFGAGALVFFMVIHPVFAVAQPDLIATKTNDAGGSLALGSVFTWKIRVENIGTANAVFGKGKEILKDEMPNSGVDDYGAPVLSTSAGVVISGSIDCTQGGSKQENLICKVSNSSGNSVIIPPGDSLDVSVSVTPTAAGTLANPRSGKKCAVDNGTNVAESNETNNSCSDTVEVITPSGTLVIIKNTVPDDARDFDFSVSGSGLSAFSLDDDGDAALSNTKTFTALAAGSYSVTESAVAGFDLTGLVCDDPIGNSSGSLETRTAAIDLADGETVTCTFTNTKKGHLIVQKTTYPEGDTTEFSVSASSDDGGVITGGGVGTVTDSSDKDYEVTPGTYSVEETIPAGWDKTGDTCQNVAVAAGETVTCLLTNTKRSSLTLKKISDPEEGEFQFDLTGLEDGSETQSHTFFPSGTWNLSDLLFGAYSLSETILAPLDWTGSQKISCNGTGDNDPSGSLTSSFGFTLNPGEAMSCSVNNTKDALITGKKFEDMDADGIAGSDAGLSGWVITATMQDNPETEEIESGSYEATTDDEGDYTLRVQPGTYHVCETVQGGWTQSYPVSETAGAVSCGGGYGYELTVSAGDNVSGKDFGNYRNGSISGYKLEDANGNGDVNEDETALDGWTIFLDANDNGVLDEGESYQETGDEEEGYYYFGNLAPGTYIVREVSQSGWTQTCPGSGSGSKHTVTVASGEDEENWNFGNFRLGTIAGFKWDDKNGDGIWQKSCEGQSGTCVAEPGLQDVVVGLGRRNGKARQEDGHEVIPIEIIAMTLTGSDGGFTMRNIPSGDYKLFEEKKSGWSATNPPARTDSFFDITYDLESIHTGDPDFDLLRVTGDPDFDLLRSSFFDVFVEVSGQEVRQSGQTRTVTETIPAMPLEFGNHKLLVINQEEVRATEVRETSTVITWTTDFPGTSRVVYDTVSHPVLGSAPNYGYANSTDTFDTDPKVTSHSVTVSGLNAETTYYYRTISAASPESVSGESSFGTSAPSSSGSGGGSSGGGNGGGGGGGGGGGAGIIILPGTSQPPANEATASQTSLEPEGQILAALTPSDSALSGNSVVPSGNETPAVSRESGVPAEHAEDSFVHSPVESVVPAEPSASPFAPEASAEPEPFLAAAIGALSFGTGSIPFASGTALAVLGLLGYGLYLLNPGNLFRKW